MAACVICGTISGRWLCEPCGRSYDRLTKKDGTTKGLIVWAARRAVLLTVRRTKKGRA